MNLEYIPNLVNLDYILRLDVIPRLHPQHWAHFLWDFVSQTLAVFYLSNTFRSVFFVFPNFLTSFWILLGEKIHCKRQQLFPSSFRTKRKPLRHTNHLHSSSRKTTDPCHGLERQAHCVEYEKTEWENLVKVFDKLLFLFSFPFPRSW